MLASLATSAGALAAFNASGGTRVSNSEATGPASFAGWLDAKADFAATGDGVADDSQSLQAAIDAGSSSYRPVILPPGVYRITRPLTVPSNTMLIGSSPGLGFGCRIEPFGCAAFIVGGKMPAFHCSIENILIWPKGNAPQFIISVDNSYSVTFRNVRIHECQDHIGRAAVLLLGEPSSGGHGKCGNIIWDNLIIRNDDAQPPVAIMATKGCGSHRFFSPDLENYAVLFEWRGGQIDLITPYTERAGRYAVNCNTDVDDSEVHFNSFGGVVDCANSGLGCAIRSSTRNFNSFGTQWGPTAELACYVYSLPGSPVWFHGLVPNVGNSGRARFSGVPGWRRTVGFAQQALTGSKAIEVLIPPNERVEERITIAGVLAGQFWARVTINADSLGVQLSAFVSSTDTVTIVAQNGGSAPALMKGLLFVECGVA